MSPGIDWAPTLPSAFTSAYVQAGGSEQQPLFLLGDFNALRRRDYSDAEWEALCEQRAAAKIRSCTSLTDALEAGPTADEDGPWGMTDCRAVAPAAQRSGLTATSVCVGG